MPKKIAKEAVPSGMIRCGCGDVIPLAKAIFINCNGKRIETPTCEACYLRSFREPVDRFHPKYDPDKVQR